MPIRKTREGGDLVYEVTGVDDAHLDLVTDDKCYLHKVVSLDLCDTDGVRFKIEFDGCQVADLVADAVAMGIPRSREDAMDWLKWQGELGRLTDLAGDVSPETIARLLTMLREEMERLDARVGEIEARLPGEPCEGRGSAPA